MSLLRRYPVTLLVAFTAILAHWWPTLTQSLVLDFSLVSDGQWWRLLTGHMTHYDANHLFWDLLMFVILGAACEGRHGRRYPVALAVMMAGVSLAVSVFPGDVATYRGLSGVDTGLFVWFACDHIVQSIRERDRLVTAIWVLPVLGLMGKLAWEVATGSTLFVDSSNFRPLVESHLAGALIGLALSLTREVTNAMTQATVRVAHAPSHSRENRHPARRIGQEDPSCTA